MRTRRWLLLVGMLIGILLLLSPVISTFVNLLPALTVLGTSGIGDPTTLLGGFEEVLPHGGLFICLPLTGAVIIAVTWMQLRKFSRPKLPG